MILQLLSSLVEAMPPSLRWATTSLLSTAAQKSSETGATFAAVRSQWQSPNDVLTILTIIGGDIVQRALAQFAGSPTMPYLSLSPAPVAFSFGWVAYAFNAVLSTIGDGRLMPPPESTISLINVKSGYARENRSWVLSRLFRDYRPNADDEYQDGLAVHFYRVSPKKPQCVSARDWVYWFGVTTILLQLGISVIPGALYGNWMVLIITAGGTLLALACSALPQWHQEKWAARPVPKDVRQVVCLTSGNGSRHVLVVISDGVGIRLEDLAGGRHAPGWSDRLTMYASFALAVLWLVHLITVEALETDAWYLLAVGGLGMVQNVIAAGACRTPDALGFHLEEMRVCHNVKAFRALQDAEEFESCVGLRLLPVFFPGGLRPREEAWRNEKWKERALDEAYTIDMSSARPQVEVYRPDDRRMTISPRSTLDGSDALLEKQDTRPPSVVVTTGAVVTHPVDTSPTPQNTEHATARPGNVSS